MDYDALFAAINKNFENHFVRAYKSVKKTKRNNLLRYMMSYYRRWYYSALKEDTILTPANICDAVCELCPEQTFYCMYTPRLNSLTRLGKMSFRHNEYMLDKHPVVNDLQLFIDSCVPDFQLDENDCLTRTHETELLSTLSIGDPYYAEYLLMVSIGLGLVAKMPSIHSNRAQVTRKTDGFFEQTSREILSQIVCETIHCATRFINKIMPGSNIINYDYIMSILTSPVETDDIFKHIYSSLGFSIEQIMDFNDDDVLDEMYASILSSTFYLGIFIDRYFFTPFGFYLKFITPGYLLPFDLAKEMSFAMDATDETEDISIAMFSPCSHYTLTRLGAEFFDLSNQIPLPVALENIQDLEPFADALSTGLPLNIATIMFEHSFSINNKRLESKSVYEIKIVLADDKGYWKKLEVLDNCTLNDLYMEICCEYNFDINMKYSFFRDLTESPFSEYRSPPNKNRGGNKTNITIKELALPLKHKFLLVLRDIASPFDLSYAPRHMKFVKLELELVKIKEIDFDAAYPRVKSEGPNFQHFDSDWPF